MRRADVPLSLQNFALYPGYHDVSFVACHRMPLISNTVHLASAIMNNTRFSLSSLAWILLGFVSYISQSIRSANAWGGNSAPVLLGIGSIFFRPRNVVLEKSVGREQILNEAGIFFTQAFW
jgi:hypothetical protein